MTRKEKQTYYSELRFFIFSHMTIPDIIHFVHFYEKSVEFLYVHYMAVHSAVAINGFTTYVHYQTLPYGQWYERLRANPKVVWVKTTFIPTHIGSKVILKPTHKVDWFKLHLLIKYGGWCLDLDTICVKPFGSLSNKRFVMAQEVVDGVIHGCCMAVMGSETMNFFVIRWMQLFEGEFVPEGWGEAAVWLPWKIYADEFWESDVATIIPCGFFLVPTWRETHKIYLDQCDVIPEQLHVLHMWNCEAWSGECIRNRIKDETWVRDNPHTLYAKCVAVVEETTNRQQMVEVHDDDNLNNNDHANN